MYGKLPIHTAAPEKKTWRRCCKGDEKKEAVEENPSAGRKPRSWSISSHLRSDQLCVQHELPGDAVQHELLGNTVQHGALIHLELHYELGDGQVQVQGVLVGEDAGQELVGAGRWCWR